MTNSNPNDTFITNPYAESGTSPPLPSSVPAKTPAAPKFGFAGTAATVGFSSILGPTAINQFVQDVIGVWVPKLPLVRSKTQFFEESFLEFVEDAAFYFTIPVSGLLLAKAFFNKTLKSQGLNTDHIGTRLVKSGLSHELIAAKAGTLLGAVAIASGFEYMIQHAKNVITAKQFNTKNFTAVAGLEHAKQQAAEGEEDPVDKARRRMWQVLGLTATGLTAAAFLPKLILKYPKQLIPKVEGLLKYIDFDKGTPFDLSKPLLAILAGVGAVSYIDAARDHLERKETATRLAVVIPYMIFGKELVGWALGKYQEKFGSVTVGKKIIPLHKLKEDFQFSLLEKVNPLKQAFKGDPAKFLDLGILKGSLHEQFINQPGMSEPLKEALVNKLAGMGVASKLISAAICGLGINAIAYHQTRQRFKAQEEQRKILANQTPVGFSPVTPTPSFSMPSFAANRPLQFPARVPIAQQSYAFQPMMGR